MEKIWNFRRWIVITFGISMLARFGVVLCISIWNHMISTCCKCCKKRKVTRKLVMKKQRFTHDPFAMAIMWFGGIFKGVIAFTLTLRYEARIMEIKPRKSDFLDEPEKYDSLRSQWDSLKKDKENTKYIIYGLVLFTNIIWGGILPLIIMLLRKFNIHKWHNHNIDDSDSDHDEMHETEPGDRDDTYVHTMDLRKMMSD